METALFQPERSEPPVELPAWVVEWRRLHPDQKPHEPDDGDEAA